MEDKFYDKAKHYLKSIIADDLNIEQVQGDSITSPLTTWEATTITRKKWKYSNDNIVTEKKKKVDSKRQLYDIISYAHNRIAHRRRQITMKWITENFTEVNQKVVNIFVKMCRFHQEQKTITSRVKPVRQPLQAQTFLSLLEIDLMDFRNCSCTCTAQQQMGNTFHWKRCTGCLYSVLSHLWLSKNDFNR